jgi:arabinose-5-phosphate isomerase
MIEQPIADADHILAAVRTVVVESKGLEALCEALHGGLGQNLKQAIELLYDLQGVLIVTGMGKSGHIGRKLAATLSSTGTPAHFVHPADASHGDLGVVRPEDAVLALSWSGESAELSDIIAYTRRRSIPLIAITARPNSTLGKAADIPLIMPDVPEACPNGLAPTTSTTVQLVFGDSLAICLLSRRNFSREDFGQFHPGGKLGAKLRTVGELMRSPAEVPIVGSGSTIKTAIFEMTAKRAGITGVVDSDGRLIGVVSDGDIRRALEIGFNDRPAIEIMNPHPKIIQATAFAEQALARMNAERVTTLFIVEDEMPAGIITVHDLLLAGYT